MERNKADYVAAVTRGEGFLPWQRKGVSEEEADYRADAERRKDDMLAGRLPVVHPVLLTEEQARQARANIEAAPWAREWFERRKAMADHIIAQPEDYAEKMIPEITPGISFAGCPRCSNAPLSENSRGGGLSWDYRNPDVMTCSACGQTYPSADYPETGVLVCPRQGQTFTYFAEDGAGHVSVSGRLRFQKASFMMGVVSDLAFVYAIAGGARYAQAIVRILERLAHCYRQWLYHDNGAFADCDPLYGAWRHEALPLEWKRDPSPGGYQRDQLDRASLAQYWSGGRFATSTDQIHRLADLCQALDLVYDAVGPDGEPLWTPESRERVERDLVLEWIFGSESFVGGPGAALNRSNKAPYIYNAQATAGRALGLPGLVETALKGYELIRDEAFQSDGYSWESPSYTCMYLRDIIGVTEALHGYRRTGPSGREEVVDPYVTDPRLRLMFRGVLDAVRPDGGYIPNGDTGNTGTPPAALLEVGRVRYPEHFREALPILRRRGAYRPSEYAILNLDARELEPEKDPGKDPGLPEIYFPTWMMSILRHGKGPDGTVLATAFSPPGTTHRHHDNLGIYYFDSGRTILGEQGYGSRKEEWAERTFSHNLVIVDDTQQLFRYHARIQPDSREERKPELRMMVTSPAVSVVEAASRAYAQCSEYRRLVALIKGPDAKTFAVDIFRVKGGSKHTYRLFSELASTDIEEGALEFPGLGMPAEAPIPEGGPVVPRGERYGLRDARTVERPPAAWNTAIWKQKDRQYRLWVLSPVDRVAAATGPGHGMPGKPGRRTRYLDVVREGQNLASTFVTIHEPSDVGGAARIISAERLPVPEAAGPNAVALRVVSAWGTYLVLNEFSEEAEVDGVRFQGAFGVVCRTPEGGRWVFASEASTLRSGGLGFESAPDAWQGEVLSNSESEMIVGTAPPTGWTAPPPGMIPYVRVRFKETPTSGPLQPTGYAVAEAGERSIRVARFPLESGGDQPLWSEWMSAKTTGPAPAPSREVAEFHLPAVRFLAEGSGR
ncbi:MAG: heparinase II/III family protein [Armatimonadetes bacterium]|nr:heparinase II/III family protein [Armatimonadota bacterium]